MKKEGVCVVGGGVAGLMAAKVFAQNGYRVTVYERYTIGSGATLNNFGQLHSGAIFAPVMPELTKVCWGAYKEYLCFVGASSRDVAHSRGLTVFPSQKEAVSYTKIWDSVGIPYKKILDNPYLHPGGITYEIPDTLLHPEDAIGVLRTEVVKLGVDIIENAEVILKRERGSVRPHLDAGPLPHSLVVVAAGVATKNILENCNLKSPLTLHYLPWALYPELITDRIVYDLGPDLLGTAPDLLHDRTIFALPGRYEEKDLRNYKVKEDIESKLRSIVMNHWSHVFREDVTLTYSYNPVIQEYQTNNLAKPFNTVVDLSDPTLTPEWDACNNLIVILSGKVSLSLLLPETIGTLIKKRECA